MASTTGTVTASSLNLRPEPNTGKPPVGKLPRGAVVEILETSGSWVQVRGEPGIGWVHGNYLSLDDGDPAAGFLHRRDDLAAIPTEPPAETRIPLRSDLSPAQQALAGIWNRYGGLLAVLSDLLGIDPAAGVAVFQVESSGRGFGGDGRLIIRFENHIFHRRWGKKNPQSFDAHFRFEPKKSWRGHRFRAAADGDWQSFHGDQDREWEVLEFARQLDEEAALSSISMGAPQIMGFNHTAIGYGGAGEMFERFQTDVRYHVFGFFDFLKGPGATSPMLEALRGRRFEDFASSYNGSGQAAAYGERISKSFAACKSLTA